MHQHHLFLLLLLPAVLSSASHKEPLLMSQETSTSDEGSFLLSDGMGHQLVHPAQPRFSASSPTEENVTAQVEGTAFLHCQVESSAGDRAVSYPSISWIRRRDWTILTNGVLTYTSDDRFSILHKEGSFDWVLQVKYVQERDAGLYECQVSTNTGKISRKVHLEVVSPVTFILGGDQYHIDQGSKISLVCVIENAPEPPQYVFWYHNRRMVNYDSAAGVTVHTSHSVGKTQSRLTVRSATRADSGNYTCKPSKIMPATIQVFVSKERVDKTEALHKQSSLLSNTPIGASSSATSSRSVPTIILLIMSVVINWV